MLDGMCSSHSSPNNDSTFVSTLCNLKILLDPDYIQYISWNQVIVISRCLPVFWDTAWVYFRKAFHLAFKLSNIFHPLPICWIPTQKRNKTYSTLYIYLAIPLPVAFVSAHDCSFVVFIVRSGLAGWWKRQPAWSNGSTLTLAAMCAIGVCWQRLQ